MGKRINAKAAKTNERIGATLKRMRSERGWTLKYVAASLDLSTSYVGALEGGENTFSAILIESMAALFQVPLSAFLRESILPDSLALEWQRSFDVLPRRERNVLLDLVKRLCWSPEGNVALRAPYHHKGGIVLSIEGVDGDLIHGLCKALANSPRETPRAYCPYDYRRNLWRYMIAQFDKLDRERVEHRAIERSLLFACERLLRYEELIVPALKKEQTVLAPFFTMAPGVYQEVEGAGDRRIVDIIETFLPKPDAIVVLRSDPAAAARKAVRHEPKAGEFYSPYGRRELARAQQLYEKAVDDYRARGYPVHVFDVEASLSSAVLGAVRRSVLFPLEKK